MNILIDTSMCGLLILEFIDGHIAYLNLKLYLFFDEYINVSLFAN